MFKNKPLPMEEIVKFCKGASSLLTIGFSLEAVIEILYLQTRSKKMKKSLIIIYDDLKNGITFSDALLRQSNLFPDIMLNLIGLGETTGLLNETLFSVGSRLENDMYFKNRIVQSIMYPMFYSLFITCIVLLMIINFRV